MFYEYFMDVCFSGATCASLVELAIVLDIIGWSVQLMTLCDYRCVTESVSLTSFVSLHQFNLTWEHVISVLRSYVSRSEQTQAMMGRFL